MLSSYKTTAKKKKGLWWVGSHLGHWDSSVPSSQSLWPSHFFCSGIQWPFRQAISPALQYPADGTNIYYIFLPNWKAFCIINVSVPFLPQFSSSVLSPQSSTLSQCQYLGLQKPFLHLIWDSSQTVQIKGDLRWQTSLLNMFLYHILVMLYITFPLTNIITFCLSSWFVSVRRYSPNFEFINLSILEVVQILI